MTGRKWFFTAGAIALLAMLGTTRADAQLAPNGWIQAEGWNILILDQADGSEGGGIDKIKDADGWTSPIGLLTDDPKAGDVYAIDFDAAYARGWTATSLGADPVWISSQYTQDTFGFAIRGANDVVDLNGIIDDINANLDPDFSNDNVLSICTTYVNNVSGGELLVRLCGASDDSLSTFVNEHNVTAFSGGRGTAGDCAETGLALLPPGVSKITAMVWEGGGGHGLRLGILYNGVRLADGNGLVEFIGTGDAATAGQYGLPAADTSVIVNNPNGWVRAKAWNLLFPVLNPYGCSGGGDIQMQKNWLAPHDIGTEDPKGSTATIWDDIDFTKSPAEGYYNGGILLGAGIAGDVPIWVTIDLLIAQFGAQLGDELPNLEGQLENDVIDYQSIRDRLQNSLVTGGAAGSTPVAGATDIPSDNVLGVATTYVENLTDQDLEIDVCSASDDGIQVWVNCQLTTNMSACRGTAGGCAEILPGVLKPGINKISTLVFEGGGGWGFRLGIRPRGTAYNLQDGNDLVAFLGAGDATLSTPDQLCMERVMDPALEQQIPVPTDGGSATVVLQSNGVAKDGPFDVEETITTGFNDYDALDVTGVSHGGVVVEERSDPRGYTSQSTTGLDLWTGCDDIQFAYTAVTGDFDYSIEIIDYAHETGVGRWGKWGAMARFGTTYQDTADPPATVTVNPLDRNAPFIMYQGHGPDPQDNWRTAIRRGVNSDGGCGNMEEIRPGDPIAKPPFFRITRRGQVTTTWVADDPGLADGTLDPTDDANWNLHHEEDWSAGIGLPDEVLVGFANSEHDSDGSNLQSIVFRVLDGSVPATLDNSTLIGTDEGGRSGFYGPDERKSLSVQWTGLTSDDLADGVAYSLASSSEQTATLDGKIVGGVGVNPQHSTARIPFKGVSAPGIFEYAHDIGSVAATGSTSYDGGTDSYTLVGSGGDIWDNGDQFHFAYQRVSGDFVATARLTAIDAPAAGRWGRTGIMARYDGQTASKMSFTCTPLRMEVFGNEDPADDLLNDNKRHHSRRDDRNNGTTRDDQEMPFGLLTQPFTGWHRLVRRGKYFYSLFADDVDGVPGRWYLVGGDSHPAPPDEVLVGLATGSHGSIGPSLATTFDNYSVVPLVTSDKEGTPNEELTLTVDFDADEGNPPSDAIVVNGGNADFGPTVVGGRLRLCQHGINSDANAVRYPIEGLGLGDNGFVAELDVFASKDDGADPADGFAFTVHEYLGETDLDPANPWNLVTRVGGGGGALAYEVGGENQIPAGRRKSMAVEFDLWDGGHGDNDPPERYGDGTGFGANTGPDDSLYHVGIDFHEGNQSAQNHVEYMGQVQLPKIYSVGGVGNTLGAHVIVRYVPQTDSEAKVEVWMSDNSDAGAEPVKVLSAIGPKFDGDLAIGACGATGGANANYEIDNVSITPLCSEVPDGVSISGDSAVDQGTVATLTATVTGADAAPVYSWSIVDGPGSIPGAADQETVEVLCDDAGIVNVKVNAGDGVCDDLAEATWAVECLSVGVGLIPGDANADGNVDLSDAVRILDKLFVVADAALPCMGSSTDPASAADVYILDWNGDGGLDLSDAVSTLTWLFLDNSAEKAHVLGQDCVPVVDCAREEDVCSVAK